MSERLSRAALVAHKAALLIERDGWCQEVGRDGRARCLVVALLDAQGCTKGDLPDLATLEALGFYGEDAIYWNDAPHRTRDEVLARLRSVR